MEHLAPNPDRPPAEPQQAALVAKLCAALRDELEAVRSRPAADRALSEGRRQVKLGNSWRYAFKSAREVKGVPSGSPGVLSVGDERHSCYLVSWHGHEVVVSVDVDLGPGVERAKLSVNASYLIEALIDRLNGTSELANPAGRLALGLDTPSISREQVAVEGLNEEQNAAVAQSLGSDCTYIWGPPGTGKTRTIGALGAAMIARKRRVLVVSHTNIAVDQAILAIADLSGSSTGASSILRVGQPHDRRLDNRPGLLADHHLEIRQREVAQRRDEIKSELQRAKREANEAQLRVDLIDWIDRSAEVVREVEDLLREAERGAGEPGEFATDAAKFRAADALTRKLEGYHDREAKYLGLIKKAKRAGKVDLVQDVEASLNEFRTQERSPLDSEVAAFESKYGERLIYVTSGYRFRRAERESEDRSQETARLRRQAQGVFVGFLKLPRTVGLQVSDSVEVASAREVIHEVESQARELAGDWTLEGAVAERDRLGTLQQKLEADLRAAEDEMKRIEEALLSEATVLGATLTAAYTRRTLMAQEFDTVIVDEASMAALPAVWAAALLAKNVVLVGDFRQLPPVAIADTPVARKWLQRDVFDLAGHPESVDRGEIPDVLTALWEQRRMKPDISRVPNALVYKNRLRDGPGVGSDKELESWARDCSWTDRDLYAIDLTSVGSYANAVKGISPSRANVLSATVSLSLAKAILDPDRDPPDTLDSSRVLIVSPYRPQGDLLQAMITAEGIETEVAAGTVHGFQGSEASAVILDLTAAVPHHRLRVFSSELDESTRRLLNVAITRARRRLYVVGELAWIKKQAGRGTTTGDLVRHLYRYADVRDGGELLAEQSAPITKFPKGLSIQSGSGAAESLSLALAGAKKQVVIFSPVISEDEASRICDALGSSDPDLRKVAVLAPASGRDSRGAREILERAGFEVAEKDHMHERAFVVDERLVGLPTKLDGANLVEAPTCWWSGPRVVGELDYVLEASQLARELADDGSACDRCGESMLLSEGSHENPGRYWKCVNCQLTRNVD